MWISMSSGTGLPSPIWGSRTSWSGATTGTCTRCWMESLPLTCISSSTNWMISLSRRKFVFWALLMDHSWGFWARRAGWCIFLPMGIASLRKSTCMRGGYSSSPRLITSLRVSMISISTQGVLPLTINSPTSLKPQVKYPHHIVNHPSDVKIAVSFTVDPSLAIEETFPSGFHIPQQNYFLPPPNNSIPSRIFSINADGSGTEYLNRQQIGSMEGFLMEEEIRGERMVRQYTKQLNSEQKYIKLSFCEEVSVRKFGLPSRLQPKKTISNLVPVKFNKVEHRAVETLSWEPDFSRLTGL